MFRKWKKLYVYTFYEQIKVNKRKYCHITTENKKKKKKKKGDCHCHIEVKIIAKQAIST